MITASLRADILAGRLEPERKLTFPELCATYSVSVGVLREALVRLVDYGIVRTENNLGFRVMGLSDDDLLELTAVRAEIEPNFVKIAVETGSVEWESQVVAAYHLMDRAPIAEKGTISAHWVAMHSDFHVALVAGCGNNRMVEIARRLLDEADFYCRWYQGTHNVEDFRARIADEHAQILDAVLSGSASRTKTLLRDHIEAATEVWLSGPSSERPAPSTTAAAEPA